MAEGDFSPLALAPCYRGIIALRDAFFGVLKDSTINGVWFLKSAARRNIMNVQAAQGAGRVEADRLKALAKVPMNEEQMALAMPTELHRFPIEVQKSVVAVLVCCGTPLFVLAVFLRMSSQTEVATVFADTIANAKSIANSRVAGSLFNTALYGEDPRSKVTAAIFWLKAQARWREDGSTPNEKQETPNAIPLNSLSDSQFSRIKAIVSEASPEDRRAAHNVNKLLEPEVIPPKKKGGKRRG